MTLIIEVNVTCHYMNLWSYNPAACPVMLVQCSSVDNWHITHIVLNATHPKSSTVRPIMWYRVYCRCFCSPSYQGYMCLSATGYPNQGFNHYRESRHVPMLRLISLSFFIHERLERTLQPQLLHLIMFYCSSDPRCREEMAEHGGPGP